MRARLEIGVGIGDKLFGVVFEVCWEGNACHACLVLQPFVNLYRKYILLPSSQDFNLRHQNVKKDKH